MENKRKEKDHGGEKQERWNLYEKWFYRNCDNNNTPELHIIKSQDYTPKNDLLYENRIIENNDNEPYVIKKNILDYAAWFQRHSSSGNFEKSKEEKEEKEERKKIETEEDFHIYTSICKKYYPFIINPVHKPQNNICKNHYKNYVLFCLTCNIHFCVEDKKYHIDHSFIDLDQIKINEEELIEAENSVKNKRFQIFNEKLDEKACEKLKKYEEEIMNFNYFIINSYRNEKNNFYKFFNFYYLFVLKKDLKKRENNNLLKLFFGLHGFKTIIYDLKNYYEKQKKRWLLKNLIAYKKGSKKNNN